MVSNRQSQILQAVVKEYVERVKLVSSGALARKYRMKISPATIRNEFAELTAEGYLEQPHASAGRKPTNRGYRHYVDREVIGKGHARSDAVKRFDGDMFGLADMLAEYSGLFAGAWREDDEVVFRGLKRIFSQPEFTDHDASMRLAQLLDDLPRMLEKLFSLDAGSGIFIGEESPLWESEEVSMLFRKIRFPSRVCGIVCIMGPTRMSYETNWQLLE